MYYYRGRAGTGVGRHWQGCSYRPQTTTPEPARLQLACAAPYCAVQGSKWHKGAWLQDSWCVQGPCHAPQAQRCAVWHAHDCGPHVVCCAVAVVIRLLGGTRGSTLLPNRSWEGPAVCLWRARPSRQHQRLKLLHKTLEQHSRQQQAGREQVMAASTD